MNKAVLAGVAVTAVTVIVAANLTSMQEERQMPVAPGRVVSAQTPAPPLPRGSTPTAAQQWVYNKLHYSAITDKTITLQSPAGSWTIEDQGKFYRLTDYRGGQICVATNDYTSGLYSKLSESSKENVLVDTATIESFVEPAKSC